MIVTERSPKSATVAGEMCQFSKKCCGGLKQFVERLGRWLRETKDAVEWIVQYVQYLYYYIEQPRAERRAKRSTELVEEDNAV